jgi:hypothetical protein
VVTDIQTEWHPQYLLSGYFQQDVFWFDADGKVHKIEEMNPHYCLNALCFMERLAPTMYRYAGGEPGNFAESARWLVRQPLYIKIKQRVKENLL